MRVYLFEPWETRQWPDAFENPALLALTAGAAGGAVIGALLAAYYRLSAWRLGLPGWADYVPSEPEPEPDW